MLQAASATLRSNCTSTSYSCISFRSMLKLLSSSSHLLIAFAIAIIITIATMTPLWHLRNVQAEYYSGGRDHHLPRLRFRLRRASIQQLIWAISATKRMKPTGRSMLMTSFCHVLSISNVASSIILIDDRCSICRIPETALLIYLIESVVVSYWGERFVDAMHQVLGQPTVFPCAQPPVLSDCPLV